MSDNYVLPSLATITLTRQPAGLHLSLLITNFLGCQAASWVVVVAAVAVPDKLKTPNSNIIFYKIIIVCKHFKLVIFKRQLTFFSNIILNMESENLRNCDDFICQTLQLACIFIHSLRHQISYSIQHALAKLMPIKPNTKG